MTKMSSRQRVREALEHREADMVPIDFGAMGSTGISAIAYNKLKDFLGVKSGETRVYDLFQQLAEPEMQVIRLFSGDVIELKRLIPNFGIKIDRWKKGILPDGSDCMVPYDFNPVVNNDGDFEIKNNDVVIAKRTKEGLYFDKVFHPYAAAHTINDIDSLPLPTLEQEELKYLRSEAKRLHEQTDYAILGAFGGSIFEQGQLDWGYEKYFIKLSLNPDLIDYYHNRLTEVHMNNLKAYLDAVSDYIDIIQFSDDLGTQENTQISVNMYKNMIKPYHSKLYQFVQNNFPNIKVFMHNCGSIYNLIPDLIDAGVQILNPVQLSAKGMNPINLKKEFGNNLVFWGGGANTQTTVTFGTIKQIREEVKELIKIFAPGGGYVFTQVHNIQADIPPEKVYAIYDTAKKYRDYPIA